MESEKFTPEMLGRFEAIVGKNNVSVEEADGRPVIRVCPNNTEQVAAVMRAGNEMGHGFVKENLDIDLSANMNRIIKFDHENYYIKVQAGVSIEKMASRCFSGGCMLGNVINSPDATASDLVYSNSPFIGMYRFGPSRNNVMNMEVALPDGTVIETGYDDISAYMSGYNFNQLFVGAQDTLGKVCTVTFRVYPISDLRFLAFNFSDLKSAAPLINSIAKHPCIKPLFVGWADSNHNKKHGYENCASVVLIALHGATRIVEAEAKEIVALANGAVRLDDRLATEMWKDVTVSPSGGAIIPVRNFAAFADKAASDEKEDECISGMLMDGQTAYFECCCGDDGCGLAKSAKDFGGRAASYENFFDENVSGAGAAAYMKELRNIIVHHKTVPESQKLSREVTPEVVA